MRASTIIALGAATLAAAAPTSTPDSCGNDSGSTDTQTYGSFFVNKFVFGCTAGCYYSFDVSFTTTTDEQSTCSGSLEDKDYVECKGESTGASYSAFIDTTSGSNLLKLQYTVQNYPNEGATTHFYGKDQVYAATSEDADKQEASFSVNADSSTAVA